MRLSRRGLFGGLAALAAPAIIRTPGLLMPIKRLATNDPSVWILTRGQWYIASPGGCMGGPCSPV
jgi:hypothetical protein